MTEPADRSAREALERDLDRSLFVKAGAGTGKTTALVRRMLAVVRAGGSLERTVAITFTKKAAAEMKDRLRAELLRLVSGAADDADRDRHARALAEVDAAPIQTIHSFAQSLLTRFPIDAGLPPILQVEEETDLEDALDRWWLEASDRLLARQDLREGWSALFDLRVAADFGRDLAGFCLRNPHASDDPQVASADVAEAVQAVRSAAAEFLQAWDAARPRLKKPYPDFEAGVERLRAYVRELPDDPGRLPERPPRLNLSGVSSALKPHWQGPVGVKEARDGVEASLDRLEGALQWRTVLPVVRAVVEESLAWRRARLAQGRLTFQDLLLEAVRLLRNRPDVLEQARGSFDRVFVDEFQDTDPLQVELIALVAGELPGGAPWEDQLRSAKPGKLLFVGDAKQSIYAFRGAEVGLFYRVQAVFPPDDVLELSTNFRIAQPTLDWINAVFPGVLRAEDPIPYEPIGCGRAETADDPPMVFRFGGPVKADEDPPGAESLGLPPASQGASRLRRAEARWAARCIASAVAEGRLVRERGQQPRPVRFGDVAVLLPTRTIEPVLLREFDAHGVPYRVESQTAMFGSQEFRELALFLRAVDDPSDEVALVGALRGPSFSLTNDDLVGFVSLHPDGWRTPPEAAAGPVGDALRELEAFRREARGLDASEVLAAAMNRFEWIASYGRNPRPRESWNRLWTLLAMARDHAERGQGALRSFVAFLETQAEERARVSEPIGAELDDDAVRVLTIHAAKGLEFPMVLLVGMGSKPMPVRDQFAWDPEGRLVVRVGKRLASPGAELAFEFLEEAYELERKRLAYVAATRTMGPLLIGMACRERQPSMARLLHDAANEADRLPELWVPGRPSVPRAAVRELTDEEREAALARFAEVRRVATRPFLASPTSISKAMLGEGPGSTEGDFPEEPYVWADRRAKAATTEGLAVHATLELYRPGCDLDALIREACMAEGAQNVEEVARMVRAGLDEPEIRAALDGTVQAWREAFLSAWVEGWLLEGYMDLLIRRPDGEFVVLDYKTDRADTEERIRNSMRHHRIQGACYALMLEQTLGRRPVRVEFRFLRPDPPIVQTVDDLDEAIGEVRSFLRDWDGAAPFA
ncbi:MAG: UvrD-helicase domain-containing protein [Fimbriimonadaceae bacterium]